MGNRFDGVVKDMGEIRPPIDVSKMNCTLDPWWIRYLVVAPALPRPPPVHPSDQPRCCLWRYRWPYQGTRGPRPVLPASCAAGPRCQARHRSRRPAFIPDRALIWHRGCPEDLRGIQIIGGNTGDVRGQPRDPSGGHIVQGTGT